MFVACNKIFGIRRYRAFEDSIVVRIILDGIDAALGNHMIGEKRDLQPCSKNRIR